MKQIFLLSLPRSGSTLLQRALSSHDKIKTVSEPWLLLPFVYALRSEGIVSEYNHSSLSQAINDFTDELPNGVDDYYSSINAFISSLYSKLCSSNTEFFLDKTPRYAFIVDELKQIFPDAKFIILWRNPLSILSSRFHSFGNKWRIYNYKVDLYKGLENLTNFHQKYEDEICTVNYERLVSNPESELSKIYNFLELPYENCHLHTLNDSTLKGSMGDKTGRSKYKEVNTEPLEKWKSTLCNPLRKIWAINYIKWIGPERLNRMGYNYDQILIEMTATKTGFSHFLSDLLRVIYGFLDQLFELSLLRKKISKLRNFRKITTYR